MYLVSKFKKAYQKFRSKLRQKYWRRVPPSRTIIDCHWGLKSERSHPKLCLFSTYDPKGRIDAYVKHYIRSLNQCGFDVVVISTSPSIAPRDLNEIKDFCRAIIHRKNIGLDFGSWKAATDILSDWKDYDALLLANDSVYGPFSDLNPLLRQMEEAEEQLCGLTDNFEESYHVQSYFLYIKGDLLRSDLFQSFWKSIRLNLDKYLVIRDYEVGLSQTLLHHDVKIKALYPFYKIREVALSRGEAFQYHQMLHMHPINASIYMWDILINNFGFPFLKTDLVKTNRLLLKNVVEWRSHIPDDSGKWHELIENHLKRAVPFARG